MRATNGTRRVGRRIRVTSTSVADPSGGGRYDRFFFFSAAAAAAIRVCVVFGVHDDWDSPRERKVRGSARRSGTVV